MIVVLINLRLQELLILIAFQFGVKLFLVKSLLSFIVYIEGIVNIKIIK